MDSFNPWQHEAADRQRDGEEYRQQFSPIIINKMGPIFTWGASGGPDLEMKVCGDTKHWWTETSGLWPAANMV